MKRQLEICAGCLSSVLAAKAGGADRVELCSALGEGGLTPSAGLIAAAVDTGMPTQVLIRARGGDFLYDAGEVRVMEHDVRAACRQGVNGVVIGALTAMGDVDAEVCARLVNAAREENEHCSITFHRAFDLCRDAHQALEDIISLGCDRLLTSGRAATAMAGIPLLADMVRWSEGRISIMPGCGVNVDNMAVILRQTGAHEIHASLRSLHHSAMQYHHDAVNMGTAGADEYSWPVTDASLVARAVASLDFADNLQ